MGFFSTADGTHPGAAHPSDSRFDVYSRHIDYNTRFIGGRAPSSLQYLADMIELF
jgi:hypothetical protein